MKSPTAAGAGRAGNIFALEDAITAAAGALVSGLKHGDRATSFTSGALFVGASEANAGSPAAGTFLRGVLPVRVNHGLSRAGCSSTFTLRLLISRRYLTSGGEAAATVLKQGLVLVHGRIGPLIAMILISYLSRFFESFTMPAIQTSPRGVATPALFAQRSFASVFAISCLNSS